MNNLLPVFKLITVSSNFTVGFFRQQARRFLKKISFYNMKRRENGCFVSFL